MKKPTYNHINALTHAITLLETASRRYGDDKLVTELHKDIKRIKEVRTMVQFNLTHPALPFPRPEKPPMFDNPKDALCEVG